MCFCLGRSVLADDIMLILQKKETPAIAELQLRPVSLGKLLVRKVIRLWRGARLTAVPSSPRIPRCSRRREARVRTSNCAYTYTGFLMFEDSWRQRGAKTHAHTAAHAPERNWSGESGRKKRRRPAATKEPRERGQLVTAQLSASTQRSKPAPAPSHLPREIDR